MEGNGSTTEERVASEQEPCFARVEVEGFDSRYGVAVAVGC